jgi:hypothetical protein
VLEPADLSAAERALVFIHARWSTPATSALRTLAGVINESYADRETLDVHVLDNDDPEVVELALALGILPEGYGEIMWIHKGQLVHKMAGDTERGRDVISRFTADLLAVS